MRAPAAASPLDAVGPFSREQAARWATGGTALLAWALVLWGGGFEPVAWGVAGIAVVGIAVASWALVRPPRIPVAVLGLLGLAVALTLWTAASVLWADTPQRAQEATGRAAIYTAALAIVLLPRWPAASLRRLLGTVLAGGVAVGAVALVRLATDDDPSALLIDGRLVWPAGYVNAAAGLWVIAVPVAIGLAAGAARSVAVRVVALPTAQLLLALCLLSQSRGALLAIAVAVAVMVVLSPRRGAVLLVTAALVAATAVGSGAIVDVRGAVDVATLSDRIDTALMRTLAASAGLLLLAVAAALLWGRLPRGARRGLGRPRTGLVASAAVAVALVVGAVAAVGNPVAWGTDKLDEALHGGYEQVAPTGDRLTGSLGSGRGDMYRVAWHAWRASPVLGIGAEDFQPVYLRDRRTGNAPRYAHSLPIGVLLGLGVVGAALAAALALGLLGGALRAWRRGTTATRTVVAVATAASVGWAAQAAWDWTWEFPTLTVLATLLLGAAARATDTAGAAPTREQRRSDHAPGRASDTEQPDVPVVPRSAAGRVGAAGLALATVAVVVGLGLLALSSAAFRDGTALAARDPAAAIERLGTAARLNPLDGDATLSRAILLRRQGDLDGWRAELDRTLRRAPNDWLAHLQRGVADANAAPRSGPRRRAALRELEAARERNPRQPVIGEVLDAVRDGRTVDPAAVERRIAERQRRLERPLAGH